MNERLLHAYPRAWRERYGRELLSLVEASSDGGRTSLRDTLDVVGAGLLQRLRSSGLAGDEVPPEGRTRAGLLLVLSSWSAFVVVGLAFAKTAEHWQAVTAPRDRGLPAAAYGGVQLAAALGTIAVLLGVALTAGPLRAFLRDGGWEKLHRPVLRALASTGSTFAVLLGVIAWAHGLTDAQRNGGDVAYGLAFLVLVAGTVASIVLWTNAAVVAAREVALTRVSLRRETLLAATTTASMAVMTVFAAIWWTAVYGTPVRMLAMTLAMAGATLLATAGTFRTVRALRA